MSNLNLAVSYKICDKCSKGLSKDYDSICKDCKPKRVYNRTLDKSLSKKYLHKFETKIPLSNRRALEATSISELALFSSKFKIIEKIPILNNMKTSNQFFKLYWDRFSDFDTFSSFITKSSQISTAYFVFDSIEIQQKQRSNKLPIILPSIERLLSVPISRPLQLLTQRAYWDSLISSYFQNVHIIIPLFSIHSFNPNAASKPLLAAIYYGGFLFTRDKPDELINYFDGYIKETMKEAFGKISIQTVISILIYSFLLLISGNLTQSRAYQAHAIRMGYTLGLHLKLARLSPIQQYDRIKLFSTLSTYHIGSNGIGNLSSNQLTEFGENNIVYLNPSYQIPNRNCAFYFDTKDENIVYGFCTDIHSRFRYIQAISIWFVSKSSEDLVQKEFEIYFNKFTQCYLQIMKVFNMLSLEFPHLKHIIQKHKLQLLLYSSIGKLELYRGLESKVTKLKSSQISKMLTECCILFDLVIESKDIKQLSHIYPYNAGLSFIRIYSISNSFQRRLIKGKLSKLLAFLSSRTCADKLSYLIIKNEYEKIIKTRS
ncbi:hypothetical protein CONCODRAFT_11515 [Conidiobolus coronatus NRRL 28638]|uniref:Xylanolytic transcriptional activator regulatory domain-containing protein n=1 Tax=Conidiobolus coronatus (strain ATCC 28846 / CBS 209.66 / NRRL 28638) TaxID=796925 RepID=A0A137NVC9_CONC2|nr:hypothetical protein CONCODRAFT_11515 [Conidiobolus coronatus NRRL 28638]|eukprot:KXN66591.1 hypothetical protein CONCODRAFT_11515 [Conidiobolus coronatus NRRL 28638]